MAKILFLSLILSLLYLFTPTDIFAQGTFTCNFVNNVCSLGQNNCDTVNGYEPILPDGSTCSDQGTSCPWLPQGLPILCNQRPTACVPNSRFCEPVNDTVFECTPDGSTARIVERCGIYRNCVENGNTASCVDDPNQPPPGIGICEPNKSNCRDTITLEQCNSNGSNFTITDCSDTNQVCVIINNTTASCQAGTYIPPGGGGSGGSAVTPGSIISLTDLLSFMNSDLGFRLANAPLGGIITTALNYVYALAGVGLLLYLISAGFSYLTSAGDPKKAEAAKGKLTTAIVGFIIIIAAFWITQIVNFVFKLGAGV